MASDWPTPGGSRCRYCLMSASPAPERLLTRNTGTTSLLRLVLAAVMQSSLDSTTSGTLAAPADLRTEVTVSEIFLSCSSGTMSTLVITTKKGTSRATAIPRCSKMSVSE